LKNALPDILSYSSTYIALMFTSQAVIEFIFNYYGLFLSSMRIRDINGVIIGFLLLFLLMHFLILVGNGIKKIAVS